MQEDQEQLFSSDSERESTTNSTFLDDQGNVQRLKIYPNVKCKYCNAEFLRRIELKNHQECCNSKEIMDDDKNADFVQSANEKNKCEFCEETFEQSDDSLWHQSRWHLYIHHFKKEIDEQIYWEPSPS